MSNCEVARKLDIKNPSSSLKTGISEYNIRVVSMSNKDGDAIIELIEDKIENNENITKQDLVSLTFTPIMGGKMNKLNKIIKSIYQNIEKNRLRI